MKNLLTGERIGCVGVAVLMAFTAVITVVAIHISGGNYL